MKVIATQVIKDQFWIAHDKAGSKIGTLTRLSEDKYKLFLTEENEVRTLTDSDIEFEVPKDPVSPDVKPTYATVHEYPTDSENVFLTKLQNIDKTEDAIPTFSKKQNGKRVFAAGYYVIEFPKTGLVEAFCPTFTNIETHYKAGPFMTEDDMKITAKQLRKNKKHT